jgi:hypothetical protein
MSDQAVSPTSNTEARVFIGVASMFAVFCVTTLAGLTYYQFNHERVPVVRHGDMGASMLGAIAVTPDDGYTPTSAYIEDGADSDVTTMGFGGKDAPEGGKARISDEDVQDVMYDHQSDLLECYIEGLDEDPEMAGRVDFHFRVRGDGHVAMVQITRSGLHDKATEDCLVDSARRWSFPSTGAASLAKFDTDFTFATE